MPWSKERRNSVAARQQRRMQDKESEIRSCLDRGFNKNRTALELGFDKTLFSTFVIENQIRPFADLGFKVITTHTLKCSGGHYHGALEQLPVMFKKREGWFCILKAYEVRRLKAAALEAEAATAEVLRLRAEIKTLKSLIGG